MQLTEGVYVFPQTIEREGVETTIHPSAVETPSGLVLIDTGFEGLTDQIETNLAEAGFGWPDVAGVVVTHQDGDHAGSLSAVVEQTGALVFAHERCVPYLEGDEHPIKSPEGQRYPPVPVDVRLVAGVTFRTAAGPMVVHFTPGHTPGHVSLHLPDADLLLAGDAMVSEGGRLAGPKPEYTPEMPEALESVRGLAELSFDRTVCYHGGPIDQGAERASAIVEGA